MKKVLFILIFVCLLLGVIGAFLVKAQTPVETGLTTAAQEGGLVTEEEAETAAAELAQVKIGQVISAVIALVGVLFMIVIIYGGILWMTAGGNAEQMKKARAYLVQAAIGLVFVGLAYAITNYIINLFSSQA
jgi:hypothetical protein